MEISTAENILSKMDKETFWRFSNKLFKPNYTEFQEIEDLHIPASRGLEVTGIGHCYQFVYLLDYFPQQIFTELNKVQISTKEIEKSLKLLDEKIAHDFDSYPKNSTPWSLATLEWIYLISNIKGIKNDDYEQYILSQYEKSFEAVFSNTPLAFGNINTYIDQQSDVVLKELEEFLFNSPDGIVFEITKDSISVNEFYLQDIIESGVTRQTLMPLQSILRINKQKNKIKEFEEVINNGTEKIIEEFIKDNFKFVFGNNYDRIETQIWLKFPHLDINHKNRFMDIFLRNAITDDWEIFELKKGSKITTHYRDLDVFVSEVYKSIEQVRNYADILNQEEVKKKLAFDGIEYCEPKLNLVIGRTPKINQKSFRRLIERNSKEVKIITYDILLKEMNYRVEDYIDFFN